jgi:DNA-binding LacI/PurR family transcriptional regulator
MNEKDEKHEKYEKHGRGSPSLQDLARKAGVSPASVSRVLNNIHPISDRLRQRVENAVRELGYVPKNLKGTYDSPMIVVLTSDLLNPYFNEIIAGIEDRSIIRRVTTVVINLKRGTAPWDAIKSAAINVKPSGYVVLGGILVDRSLADFAMQVKVPVIAVNHAIRHELIRTINIDYTKATYAAAIHLIKLGHRRLSFLGGHQSSAVNISRIQGVEAAVAEAGFHLPKELIVYGPSTIEWGFQAMNALLARQPNERPTAVLCSCDLIALGVLHAVRSLGLSVPRDISVVGFDDIDMACHANPPLTTISPPKYEMGQLAADLLFQRSEDVSHINEYIMIESPLVVRESTAFCSVNESFESLLLIRGGLNEDNSSGDP